MNTRRASIIISSANGPIRKGYPASILRHFDENWKDAGNPGGSENYFGLFTIDGKAKYALWDQVDEGVFEGLGRGDQPITKTYNGVLSELLKEVASPPVKESLTTQQ